MSVEAYEELAAGERIGPYRIEGRLGRGASAIVVRARHVRLGSRHALKVLTTLSPLARARFLREGRLQASLRHPHVVPVTDVLETAGRLVLVQEWIRGPSLARLLSTARLEPAQVDALARGILAGMAAVHERGFVHRDLKPSNILLDPAHDGLVPRIADFGLARLLEPDPADDGHTRTGVGLGTPGYMAPEQLRGARDVDTRADVFSLGCVLYEMLAGRAALPADDPIEAMDQLRACSIEPLPECLPDPWRKTVMSCLSLHPDDRPADASALLGAWLDRPDPDLHLRSSLSDFTLEDGLVTPVPSPMEDLGPRRRWLGWSLTAAGLAALSGAAVDCPDDDGITPRPMGLCQQAPCALRDDIGVAEHPAARVLIGAPGERAGVGAAVVGDWTGDGLPDVLAISTQTDAAYVISGLSPDDARLDQGQIWTGEDLSTHAWGLAADDGVARLALGAPSARAARGRVYVLRSDRSAGDLDQVADAIFEGKRKWQSGFALNQLEIEGDRLPWLAIGSLNASMGSGRVDFFAGDRRGPLDPDEADHSITGIRGEAAATSIVVADLDGDGEQELLLGTPARDLRRGGVAVLSDALDAHTTDDAIGRWTGDIAGARLGVHAAALGDVDGDGRDDVAISATGLQHEDGSSGEVFVLLGRSDLADRDLYASAAATIRDGSSASFGYRVFSVGDLDRDGLMDLAFPSDSPSAPVGVLYGPVHGSHTLDTADLRIDAPGPWNLGASLAHGDLDGDGWQDLVLGAPGISPGAGGLVLLAGGRTRL